MARPQPSYTHDHISLGQVGVHSILKWPVSKDGKRHTEANFVHENSLSLFSEHYFQAAADFALSYKNITRERNKG